MSGLSQGTRLLNLKSVTLTIVEQLTFDAQKFWGHVTLATPPFQQIFKDHMWTVPGNVRAKFEVRSFYCFGIISTYFPKNRGHVTPATPIFPTNFKEVTSRLSLGTCLPNLKLVALNVLVLDRDHHVHYKIDVPKFADPRLTAVSPQFKRSMLLTKRSALVSNRHFCLCYYWPVA